MEELPCERCKCIVCKKMQERASGMTRCGCAVCTIGDDNPKLDCSEYEDI
jgi:hypothetical protein